jgi:parallel beta-helix repeat protein
MIPGCSRVRPQENDSVSSLASLFRRRTPKSARRRPLPLRAEALEPRALLATFTVSTLLNAGAGSLRAAINQANANPGADEIAFAVAGTIPLSTALPAVTDPVAIDGSTAPGFVGSPRLTVNFRGQTGLRFAPGSDGSSLTSLALVRASGAGVTLDASGITLARNSIGVLANGTTAAPNTGAGVLVTARGSGNQIGLETTIDYDVTTSVTAAGGGTLPVAGWQGLTTAGTPGEYLITGTTTNPNDTSETAGLLYQGPLTAQGGAGYVMVMPDPSGQTTDGTTSYSADNLGNGQLRIVGTYSITGAPNELGFIFEGTVDEVGTAANYAALPMPHPSATWNIPHSTSGGLVVGNYDSSTSGGMPAGGGLAYVYDAVNRQYLVPSMVYPGSASNTAYGIWHNGGTSYTIAGGFANSPINNLLNPRVPLSQALLVDFDSATGQFSNWKSYTYTSPTSGASGITHFEGISGVEPGTYTLAATAATEAGAIAGFVTVRRNADGSFGDMQWTDLTPPVVGGSAFADSVYGNAVVGIDPSSTGVNAYQATITPGGNLISGNGGAGVRILGDNNVVASNLIGTTITGAAALANGGDGVRLEAGATGNLVGHADPVTGIAYASATDVTLPVESWTGIRGIGNGDYLITGSTVSGGVTSGLLYVGTLDGGDGEAYAINYPGGSGTTTSVYGPDYLGNGEVLLVGTYVLPNDSTRYGFAFRGNLNTMASDVLDPTNYETITNGSPFNYLHSTMGGLAVGNFITSNTPNERGRAYIYDFQTQQFTDIVFPGSLSNTAYGIWDNGDGSYTIAGGFSQLPVNNADDRLQPIGLASLIDYDRATGTFSNWRAYSYQSPDQVTAGTHFMGISSVEKGVYTLSGTGFVSGTIESSGLATVVRQTDGSFGDMTWVELDPPESVTGVSGLPSANSVYGNAVVGIVLGESGSASYQAQVNVGFQLSNVVSGNRGHGVAIVGANDNEVAMNNIGTSFAGTAAVPNHGNGILVTNRSSGNLIGGQATGGNAPVSYSGSTPVFVRPPQGNLVSGNRGNGILLTGGATGTTLSGNFVGTTPSGTAALGNGQDGVAIVGASGNSLIGTTFPQNPFVFYNVLSGNSGNGLRITNSNDTTVWANFMGLGANNATTVANGGNGLLVSGTSQRTLVGGPIPMGNGISGNNRHGIELRDSVGSFTSFNTFAGLYAFGGAAPNRLNGIEITATGGNNLIRTCLVGGNFGNGIHIGGRATGVQIEDTSVGTNSAISVAIPNYGSGILIDGQAHGNAIGGFQPSVETKVHLSGNLRYGLEITGKARNNRVFNSVIGAALGAPNPIPNGLGGVFVGPGTANTIIGGAQPFMANRVLTNNGAGITISGSSGNRVLGNEIRGNLLDGITLVGATSNTIGAVGAANAIVSNGLNGIAVAGNSRGTSIVANSIVDSGASGLLLNAATDLLVGGTVTGVGNTIVTSADYGLLAVGACNRTRVIRNLIAGNTLGDVDLASATGITYLP